VPVRERLSFVRAEPEVRQSQRHAGQGRGAHLLDAADADGLSLSISRAAVRRREDNALNEEDDMKYALLIYSNDTEWDSLSEDEKNAIYGEYAAVSEAAGVYGGSELQPGSTATTVRVQDGRTLTTDGPFPETKEALGGFFLFEADDLDAALELAARIPAARRGGAVEVRPVVER
jgi:hypothetical protein